MRRLTLAFVAISICVAADACMSSTSPDGGRRIKTHGDTTADGAYCSGYILPNGECSEGH
jgi:hypothetical protein